MAAAIRNAEPDRGTWWMTLIQNLRLLRRDGHHLPETGRAAYLARHGLKIDKVVEAHWEADGIARSIRHEQGIGVRVVSGRQFLDVIFDHGQDLHDSRLAVVNADGSIRFVVANLQQINGAPAAGFFRWTENAVPDARDAFSGMFEHPNGEMFRIVIDAVGGEVLSVRKTR
jgi:hypothetical protein